MEKKLPTDACNGFSEKNLCCLSKFLFVYEKEIRIIEKPCPEKVFVSKFKSAFKHYKKNILPKTKKSNPKEMGKLQEPTEKYTLYYTSSKCKVIDLCHHIRNAYCHSLLESRIGEKGDRNIFISDIYKRGKEIKISSRGYLNDKDFFKFLELIVSSYEKREQSKAVKP